MVWHAGSCCPFDRGWRLSIGEAAVVEQLITDLKTNFGVRVSYNIILDRSGGGRLRWPPRHM
jgi:hypothetical protein